MHHADSRYRVAVCCVQETDRHYTGWMYRYMQRKFEESMVSARSLLRLCERRVAPRR